MIEGDNKHKVKASSAYIFKPINLGRPSEQPKPLKAVIDEKTGQYTLNQRGGRPTSKTQYDLAYERRKGLYHRLVRLPQSGAIVRFRDGAYLRNKIIQVACELNEFTKKHKLTLAVKERLENISGYKRIYDERVIRRILRAAGY